MAKDPRGPSDAVRAEDVLKVGQERTEAALRLQKELLEAYEQASRSWLSRIKSEMELWSELTSKLTATQTVPEAIEAYQKYVTERMQMAAEDGQRTFNEWQEITQKITRSLSGGWPSASS
jgi:hypothetical protein